MHENVQLIQKLLANCVREKLFRKTLFELTTRTIDIATA